MQISEAAGSPMMMPVIPPMIATASGAVHVFICCLSVCGVDGSGGSRVIREGTRSWSLWNRQQNHLIDGVGFLSSLFFVRRVY